MRHPRYLRTWIAILAIILISVASFNALVDPYDVIGSVRIPGFNLLKPEADEHSRLTKPYQVERLHPRAVIVGTSRAEVGIDPDSPDWPEAVRPVYNFGLPGANLATVYRELEAAGSTGHLKLAVILLDFENFLRADPEPDLAADENQRMPSTPEGRRSGVRAQRSAEDIFLSTMTLDAFADSLATVIKQHMKYTADITADGRWSEASFESLAASDGYYELFTQKDVDYAKRNAWAARSLTGQSNETPGIDLVRQMLEYCSAHQIQPILIIPPYHADLLEMFDKAGLWDRFEHWKRNLVNLVADYSALSKATVELWDFSGYDRYTTEPVPQKGDRHTALRWFWEAGHFKRALGDLILARVFAAKRSDFGVDLTPKTIDRQLEEIRTARDNYRTVHDLQVARVAKIYLLAAERL
jgi:hypothetical protein